MQRDELKELHYITPIANVSSILKRGLLSNQRMARIPHQSVAMEEIQARRRRVRVPGGRPLHEYVNLYICARNPMLYRRKDRHKTLCVLRIRSEVIDLPGTVIADRNASSNYVRFAPAPSGLMMVDAALVFAEYWTHSDQIQTWRHKSIKAAEVLVPDRVSPEFVFGAYVSCEASYQTLKKIALALEIVQDPHFFFLTG